MYVLGAWLSASLTLGACGGGAGTATGNAGAGVGGAAQTSAGAVGLEAAASAGLGGGGITGAGGSSISGAGGASGAQNTAGAGAGGNTSGGTPSGGNPSGGNAGSAGRAGASAGNGGQTPTANGCIVPLYSYPSDATWTTIVHAKQAHAAVTVVAIVNPDSGPGTSIDKLFTSGIAKLVTAGIVPIGYVSTNYTKRGQAAVNADTDSWRNFYPAVQGIFFDEQSATAGDEGFYAAVSAHAKAKGLTFTVGNPGTNVPNSFLGALDVMLSYESAGTPALGTLSQYAAHREQFGIIPYAATFDATYVKAAAKSVRYVYLTNDDLPNPWDTLPSYFDALLTALSP